MDDCHKTAFIAPDSIYEYKVILFCNTGTSSQCRSDGNIELVRFLNSHEGDGVCAVFTSVELLYKNNFPNDPPSKFAHH